MSKVINRISKDINKNIIGIIIPSFNNQSTIKRCLDSVEKVKKNKNYIFYCVCIDDFSKDNTKEILIEYNKKKVVDKIICNKNNKGISASRNIGIRICEKTDWIMFLDADDELFDEFNIKNSILNPKYSQIIFSHISIKKNQETIKHHFKNNVSLSKPMIIDYLFKYFSIPNKFSLFNSCWGRLFNSKLILSDKVSYFNEKMNTSEDVDFTLKNLLKNPRCFYIRSVIYKHYESIYFRPKFSASIARKKSDLDLFGFIWAVRTAKMIILKYSKKIQIISLNQKIYHCLSAYFIIYFIRSTLRIYSINTLFKTFKTIRNVSNHKYFRKCFKYYSPKKAQGNKLIFLLIKYKMIPFAYLYAFYIAFKRYK